jgi:Family of unknown function (DUF5985)
MPGSIYLLCAATSLACSGLLLRGYRRNRVRLLLWSSVCFAGLALENILLFVDVIVIPGVDLSLWRSVPAVAGLMILLYGLIWDVG